MAFNLAYSKYFKDFRIFYIEKEIILVTYKEVNFCKKFLMLERMTYAIYII